MLDRNTANSLGHHFARAKRALRRALPILARWRPLPGGVGPAFPARSAAWPGWALDHRPTKAAPQPQLAGPDLGVPEGFYIERWLHGGATVSVERPDGTRQRILDIYDTAPGARREVVIAALIATDALARYR